jgi:glycosyltransferase involved in cell wall biosynthesis
VKILLVANTDWYLYNFRLGLAQALRQRGDEVVLVSPNGPYAARLQEAGFRWVRFPMERRGLNPWTEWMTILRLYRLYRQEAPELVQHFTVKCVLYGSLACRMRGIKQVVNSVEGLGYVFTPGNGVRPWLRSIIKMIYRPALRGSWVIFHNPDDMEFFHKNRLADPQKMVMIRSSGVDLQKFSPRPYPEGVPLVILPARMLWDKGLKEFIEAAGLLRSEGIEARFALVGDVDEDNPMSVDTAQLKKWENEAVIEWWGWQEKMEDVYAQAAIVCLPSFYREGVPKALIEAAACGRPIVTSNVAGCREAVRQGENGLLVPVRDVPALAKALKQLLLDPDLRKKMGACSRKVAEEDFSIERINAETLAVYEKYRPKLIIEKKERN